MLMTKSSVEKPREDPVALPAPRNDFFAGIIGVKIPAVLRGILVK
jgi:hypothetical protein